MTNTDAAAASPTTTTAAAPATDNTAATTAAAAPATAATAAAPATDNTATATTDTAATCTATAAKFSISAMADINNIRRSAFDFRTPRRDALLPYFCLIVLLIIFLFFLTNFASISGFMPKIIWRCLFFGLSALCLLPLPAAFSRRLKARHAAAQTPPEAQNCKADTPKKTTRFPFWHKYQPCFRLTIVVLCIFAMLVLRFKSGAVLLFPCLIIGICEEFILLYKLRKTILPPQTPTAKQPFGSSSANNIAQPVSTNSTSANSPHPNAPQNFDAGTSRSPQNFDINTSRAPLLLAQQSLVAKAKTRPLPELLSSCRRNYYSPYIIYFSLYRYGKLRLLRQHQYSRTPFRKNHF